MIVVFGSLNADLVFSVDRLPRPGETVLTAGYDFHPGGKGGNQAVAAARAGAAVRLFGRVGPDDHGARLIDLQRAAGVDTAGILRDAAPTGLAFISVDRAGENQIVVASGANLQARAGDVPDLALVPAALVVAQMELAPAETAAVLKRARARGARTLLNLAPALPIAADALGALDWLVVNRIEADMLAAPLGLAGAAPEVIAQKLARAHGFACVITLGRAGAVAADAKDAWAVDALPVQAVDTTGAGDAFVGVLAAALDAGPDLPEPLPEPLPRALRRASVAAGLACTAWGAQSALPDRAAIDAAEAGLAPARALVVSE
jgi:ribokinase